MAREAAREINVVAHDNVPSEHPQLSINPAIEYPGGMARGPRAAALPLALAVGLARYIIAPTSLIQ